MAALAERTAYSKSSWERYLNGKQLAPRQAVETLCSMAGEPPARLVALWELADAEWSGRADRAAPSADRAAAAPSHGDRPGDRKTSAGAVELGPAHGWSARRRRWTLATAVCAVGLAVTLWVTTLPHTSAKNATTRTAPTAPPSPACHTQGCTGKKPLMTGCAAPGHVKDLGPTHRTSTGARLAFRYGTQCRAAWAMLWNAKVKVGDTLELSVPGNKPQQVEAFDSYEAQGPLITPMLDGTDLSGLRACFEPVGSRHTECFQPYP